MNGTSSADDKARDVACICGGSIRDVPFEYSL